MKNSKMNYTPFIIAFVIILIITLIFYFATKKKESFNLKPDSDSIPCPFLNILYNQEVIVPDSSGYISVKGNGSNSFEHAWKYIGFDYIWRGALEKIANKGRGGNGKVNLFTLPKYFDHKGSTGIRDNTNTSNGIASGALVKPQKLETLKSYGDQSTQRIWARDFGKSALVQEKTDVQRVSGLPVHGAEGAEYAVLLQVFGRRDNRNSEPYLTFDDVEKIWIHGQFPTNWKPHPPDSLRLSILSGSFTDILSSFVEHIPCPSISRFGVSANTQKNQCEKCPHFCKGCKLNSSFFGSTCEYNP